MAMQQELADLEKRVAAAGYTVSDVCREAGIARSTWDRWRRGQFEPRRSVWARAEQAAERLVERSAQAAVPAEAAE